MHAGEQLLGLDEALRGRGRQAAASGADLRTTAPARSARMPRTGRLDAFAGACARSNRVASSRAMWRAASEQERGADDAGAERAEQRDAQIAERHAQPPDGVRTERQADERDHEQIGRRRGAAHARQHEILHRRRAGTDPQARGHRDRKREHEAERACCASASIQTASGTENSGPAAPTWRRPAGVCSRRRPPTGRRASCRASRRPRR